MIVIFEGLPGSGKITLIENLSSNLKIPKVEEILTKKYKGKILFDGKKILEIK